MVLWCHHHRKATARVDPIHAMNETARLNAILSGVKNMHMNCRLSWQGSRLS